MRKIVHWIVALAFFAMPAIAKAKTLPEVTHSVSVANLSIDQIGEIMLGLHPGVAVEFSAGDPTSIEFLHNFGIVSIRNNPNMTFKVEKTFYLRCVRQKLYISEDLTHWEKPHDYFASTPDLKWDRKGSALRLHTILLPEEKE